MSIIGKEIKIFLLSVGVFYYVRDFACLNLLRYTPYMYVFIYIKSLKFNIVVVFLYL
jgi:hypothetical protein